MNRQKKKKQKKNKKIKNNSFFFAFLTNNIKITSSSFSYLFPPFPTLDFYLCSQANKTIRIISSRDLKSCQRTANNLLVNCKGRNLII